MTENQYLPSGAVPAKLLAMSGIGLSAAPSQCRCVTRIFALDGACAPYKRRLSAYLSDAGRWSFPQRLASPRPLQAASTSGARHPGIFSRQLGGFWTALWRHHPAAAMQGRAIRC